MNCAGNSFSVRHLAAAAFSVLLVGIGAGTASADPASQTHDYFAQIAAGTRPDDRAGVRGANIPSATAKSNDVVAGIRPDDRAGFRGANDPASAATSASSSVRPDDRAGIRGIDSTVAEASGVSIGGTSGFDWGDAGVGAASTFALMLLGTGLFVARGRLRAPASHA